MSWTSKLQSSYLKQFQEYYHQVLSVFWYTFVCKCNMFGPRGGNNTFLWVQEEKKQKPAPHSDSQRESSEDDSMLVPELFPTHPCSGTETLKALLWVRGVHTNRTLTASSTYTKQYQFPTENLNVYGNSTGVTTSCLCMTESWQISTSFYSRGHCFGRLNL